MVSSVNRQFAGAVIVSLGLAACAPDRTGAGTSIGTSTTAAPAETTTRVTSTRPPLSGQGEPGPGHVIPRVPRLEPITGYRDVSDVPYTAIDWCEVTALVVQCVNDQGILVRLSPPVDGVGFDEVAMGRKAMAGAVVDACQAGLHIPACVRASDGRADSPTL